MESEKNGVRKMGSGPIKHIRYEEWGWLFNWEYEFKETVGGIYKRTVNTPDNYSN